MRIGIHWRSEDTSPVPILASAAPAVVSVQPKGNLVAKLRVTAGRPAFIDGDLPDGDYNVDPSDYARPETEVTPADPAPATITPVSSPPAPPA